VPLGSILAKLKEANVAARAIILDCCRSGAGKAGASKGIEDIDADVKKALGQAVIPDGTLIAFAASPGRKAAAYLKESDSNSPFTSYFCNEIATTGGNLRDIAENAGAITKTKTGQRQVPYVSWVGDASVIKSIILQGRSAPVQLAKMQTTPVTLALPDPPKPAPTSPIHAGAIGKSIQITLPGRVAMKFCYCPAGRFTMGSPASEVDRTDDEQQVNVRLSQPYWLGRTEVTQGQWQAIMGTTPAQQKATADKGHVYGEVGAMGADQPMYFVSAVDADAFVAKLNAQFPVAGWRWVLPSEAQWEYACRAGTESVFRFGDVLNGKQANCDGNYPYGTTTKGTYLQQTCEVGSYAANAWGLCDMHGNVYEWCADSWDGTAKTTWRHGPT
jgi:formylglycine-generating enzyme required for sulfatase activity